MRPTLPLAFLLASLPAALTASAAGLKTVSLLALIADPRGHDGRAVRVVGYARLEAEDRGLYLHREDSENRLYANGLRLEPGEACSKAAAGYDRRYALIEGTFDAADRGPTGLWSGSLKGITRCEPWEPAPASFMKPKARMLKR